MKTIYILGFGCGEKKDMTRATLDILKKSDRVFVRTTVHPAAEILDEEQISYTSFDGLYETKDTFEEVYEAICAEVLNSDGDTVSYIVPGHPSFAEKAVSLIVERANCEVKIIPSVSFLDGIFAALKTDAADGFKLIDALNLSECPPDVTTTNVIFQVYDSSIASDVKLTLMDYYPDEAPMYIITGAGCENEKVTMCPLYECDMADGIDHLTSFVIPPYNGYTASPSFSNLERIIAKLRSPEGCAWDREQTHETLTKYLIEESYECVDAINRGDTENLTEELGDVLLQVLLHAQIAKEESEFNLSDVIRTVSDKMIYRHPHVFGGETLDNDLLVQWDKLKQKEHDYQDVKEKLSAVPKALPALMYAQKLQSRAVEINSDLNDEEIIFNKLDKALEYYKNTRKENSTTESYIAAGKILFLLTDLMRIGEIDSENALKSASEDFLNKIALDTDVF